MNKFRFDAMVQEFPFLKTITKGSDYLDGRIKIERIDENVLNSIPQRKEAIGSLVGIDDRQEVCFIRHDGTIVSDAVTTAHSLHSNYAHDDGFQKPGESILEAIDRTQIAPDLAYAVILHTGYVTVNHYSTRAWSLTVYKSSLRVPIDVAIKLAKVAALAEVEAEAAF